MTAQRFADSKSDSPSVTCDSITLTIEATNVTGLAVYCVGMTLIMGALAWANHLDRRQEIQQLRQST